MYGVRENALRMRAKEVISIGMNSAFGEYCRPLWNRYGLIFTDAGFSGEAESMILPEEHLRIVMNENFDEGAFGLLGGKDLLKLSCSFTDSVGVRFATDNGGEAIRKQAVRFMKDRFDISYIEKLYEIVADYEEYSFSENQMDMEKQTALSEIGDKQNDIALKELVDQAGEAVTNDGKTGFLSTLKMVVPDPKALSTISVDLSMLAGSRDKNEGNLIANQSENLADKLFFREYLMTKCPYYMGGPDSKTMKYQIEYLIAGKKSDISNLETVVNRILLIREAANLYSLCKDSSKQAVVQTASTALAYLIVQPELKDAIASLINCIWSYAESVKDLKRLLAGGKVPFVKTEDEWVSGFVLNKDDADKTETSKGLEYTDYLRLLLYLNNTEVLTERFVNLVELEIRAETENDGFRMDYCFDAWEVNAYVRSGFGYSYCVHGYKDMEE